MWPSCLCPGTGERYSESLKTPRSSVTGQKLGVHTHSTQLLFQEQTIHLIPFPGCHQIMTSLSYGDSVSIFHLHPTGPPIIGASYWSRTCTASLDGCMSCLHGMWQNTSLEVLFLWLVVLKISVGKNTQRSCQNVYNQKFSDMRFCSGFLFLVGFYMMTHPVLHFMGFSPESRCIMLYSHTSVLGIKGLMTTTKELLQFIKDIKIAAVNLHISGGCPKCIHFILLCFTLLHFTHIVPYEDIGADTGSLTPSHHCHPSSGQGNGAGQGWRQVFLLQLLQPGRMGLTDYI